MENIAGMIDHTLLKPDSTKEQVIKICQEAKKYKFASVCVNPFYVKLVKEQLEGSDIKVCVTIGFPLGSNMKDVKAYEAQLALENGADELDMVMNVAAIKNKDYKTVLEDMKAVVEKAKGKAIVKVILETCLLTDDEKIKACELALEAGVNFVKTSTGFSTGGATVQDIILMKNAVGNKAKVKASGGIRDTKKALEMIKAGAERIGASSSIAIVEGIVSDSGY